MSFDLIASGWPSFWGRHPTGSWVELPHLESAEAVSLAPDGLTALIRTGFGRLALIDLPDAPARGIEGLPGNVITGSFSGDGVDLALLFNNFDGTGLALYHVEDGSSKTIWFDPRAGWANESTVVWSPDSRHIMVCWYGHAGSDDNWVTVIDRDGKSCGPALLGHPNPFNSTAWTSGGLFLQEQFEQSPVLYPGFSLTEEIVSDRVLLRTEDGHRLVAEVDADPSVIDASGQVLRRVPRLPEFFASNRIHASSAFVA